MPSSTFATIRPPCPTRPKYAKSWPRIAATLLALAVGTAHVPSLVIATSLAYQPATITGISSFATSIPSWCGTPSVKYVPTLALDSSGAATISPAPASHISTAYFCVRPLDVSGLAVRVVHVLLVCG